MKNIFVVEDDPLYRKAMVHKLSMDPEYKVQGFGDADSFLERLSDQPDIVTLDLSLGEIHGRDILKKINQLCPDTKIVVVSGQEEVNVAVEMIRLGAFDYLYKNEETLDQLWDAIHSASSTEQETSTTNNTRRIVQPSFAINDLILGKSTAVHTLIGAIERTLDKQIPVMLHGETGTGKELVARSLHFASARRNKKFVALNVASIPEHLMESELFGYEKGAFTGATGSKAGKLEEANEGTLFLDEIAELSPNAQVKLLRTIEEMELTRLGSNTSVPLNFYLITASHKNLLEEVDKGNFRSDLYYRLKGITIALPPLRERGDDVILLANHFIASFCAQYGMPKKTLSKDAERKLRSHPFPGNVRELKAVMGSAVIYSDSDRIEDVHITLDRLPENDSFFQEGLTMSDYTGKIIAHYLKKNDYNVVRTAKELNIGKSTIYRLVERGSLDIRRT
jgi:DNA-binding NtrC family response regulator